MVSHKTWLLMVMTSVVSGNTDTDRCSANECDYDVNAALSLLQHRAAPVHKDSGAKTRSTHSENPVHHWGYDDTGAWSQGFPDCAGTAQSPIDLITTARPEDTDILDASYRPVPSEGLKVLNNGHAIQVNGQFGELRLPDGIYKVLQFHFHCPSEHTVAGKSFACEMHIVHQKEGSSGTADLAVIGILFEEVPNRPWAEQADSQVQFLRTLGFPGHLPNEGEERSIRSGVDIDLGAVFEKELRGHFWHYRGSLTTPPCSETVHWYVLQDTAPVSTKMVQAMRTLFDTNNRPVQPVNSRVVVEDSEEINDTEFPQAQVRGSDEPVRSEKPVHHWGYDDAGAWSQGFPDCAGTAQSPIDLITTARPDDTQILEASYGPVPSEGLKVLNNGHAIQVNGQFGELRLPDGIYKVLQFHFHCPSEHTVAGKSFPCEMHIVHQKEGSTGTADLAVIGILFEEMANRLWDEQAGVQLQFLRTLGFAGNLPEEGEERSIQSGQDIDLGAVFEKELLGHFWHYRGSLTTPPCSETVHWYVLQDTAPVTAQMVQAMRTLFDTNNRPVQPVNSRAVVEDSEEINDTEFPQAHVPGAHVHWNYGSPSQWGEENPDCEGEAQSPINLQVPAGTPGDGSTILSVMNYGTLPSTGLKLKNNGHALQVNGNFGTLSMPDGEYEAKQFHFHSPSEHQVNGITAQGEMHIVHQKIGSTGTDDLVVIGILFDNVRKLGFNEETGLHLAFLRGLGFGNDLPEEDEEVSISNSEIDLLSAFANILRGPYWHYQGSLTTPPCSETVHWYVLEKRAAITEGMLSDFKNLFPNPMNNRPVQELNGRAIAQSLLSVPGEW